MNDPIRLLPKMSYKVFPLTWEESYVFPNTIEQCDELIENEEEIALVNFSYN